MSKITACDRELKGRRDNDGSVHLELWDNFLSEWQVVGNVVKEGKHFVGQCLDHKPFNMKTQKAAKSWVDQCYVANRFKLYNV